MSLEMKGGVLFKTWLQVHVLDSRSGFLLDPGGLRTWDRPTEAGQGCLQFWRCKPGRRQHRCWTVGCVWTTKAFTRVTCRCCTRLQLLLGNTHNAPTRRCSHLHVRLQIVQSHRWLIPERGLNIKFSLSMWESHPEFRGWLEPIKNKKFGLILKPFNGLSKTS